MFLYKISEKTWQPWSKSSDRQQMTIMDGVACTSFLAKSNVLHPCSTTSRGLRSRTTETLMDLRWGPTQR